MVKKKMLRKTKMFVSPVLLLYIGFLFELTRWGEGSPSRFAGKYIFFVISGQKFI
jgi:hypothetical protein